MEFNISPRKAKYLQITQLLDTILDVVLALNARLADSNMDSNCIGGISCSLTEKVYETKPYYVKKLLKPY